MKGVLALSVVAVLMLVPLLSYVQAQQQEAFIATMGDVGGNKKAIANLKAIDSSGAAFIGLGDYMYGSHPGNTVGSTTLGGLWDNIEQKIGAPGNHECEKNQETKWSATAFKFKSCTKGWSSWKYNNIGVIVINPYTNYKVGSEQYNYVVAKSKQFTNRTDLDWTAYVFHPPIYTPVASGGHGPDTKLRAVYEPIIKQYGGVILNGHNHITAFGKINGIPMIICGGGGEGGDTIGKLNGFSYGVSSVFGYCLLHFTHNNILVQHIDANGVVKGSENFDK